VSGLTRKNTCVRYVTHEKGGNTVNQYICPACGKTCYSAASLDNAIDPSCPYCGADMRTEKAAPDESDREAANGLISTIKYHQTREMSRRYIN